MVSSKSSRNILQAGHRPSGLDRFPFRPVANMSRSLLNLLLLIPVIIQSAQAIDGYQLGEWVQFREHPEPVRSLTGVVFGRHRTQSKTLQPKRGERRAGGGSTRQDTLRVDSPDRRVESVDRRANCRSGHQGTRGNARPSQHRRTQNAYSHYDSRA